MHNVTFLCSHSDRYIDDNGQNYTFIEAYIRYYMNMTTRCTGGWTGRIK